MNKTVCKKKLLKEKDTFFAVVLSFVLHIFITAVVLANSSKVQSIFALTDKDKNRNESKEFVFLVEPSDIPEEDNVKDSIFASDKNINQKGAESVNPGVFFSDSSIFSFNNDYSSKTLVERNLNTQKPESLKQNSGETIHEESIENPENIEIYKPRNPNAKTDTKVPASFDEGSDRAVVLSSETGAMQLGTKAKEYFWYFYTLVGAVRKSWVNTIPNQAHFLGLIRTDEVEVLLSIDESGQISFESFLKRSERGQTSLDNSCSKAIEYAGKLKPPPQGLVRDYAENGKIYIPFRFIYQNFSE